MRPMVCGGVISVMMIQQMGPTPSEKADTKMVMKMMGRMDVDSPEAAGATVVLANVVALETVGPIVVASVVRCEVRFETVVMVAATVVTVVVATSFRCMN